MAGYSASGDSLAAAHKSISGAVSDAQDAFRMLGESDVVKTGFGELAAHQQRYDPYTKALGQLKKGADAVCTSLNNFASKLDTSGKAYVNTEGDNTAGVNNAGGN